MGLDLYAVNREGRRIAHLSYAYGWLHQIRCHVIAAFVEASKAVAVERDEYGDVVGYWDEHDEATKAEFWLPEEVGDRPKPDYGAIDHGEGPMAVTVSQQFAGLVRFVNHGDAGGIHAQGESADGAAMFEFILPYVDKVEPRWEAHQDIRDLRDFFATARMQGCWVRYS